MLQVSRVLLQDVVLPAAATFDSDLDNVLTKMPYTLQFTGADKEGCQAGLNDLSETSVGVDRDVVCPSLSAQLATYFADSGSSYKTTICTCDGGPYDAESLASLVSGIPPFLLYFVRGELALVWSAGLCSSLVCLAWQLTETCLLLHDSLRLYPSQCFEQANTSSHIALGVCAFDMSSLVHACRQRLDIYAHMSRLLQG